MVIIIIISRLICTVTHYSEAKARRDAAEEARAAVATEAAAVQTRVEALTAARREEEAKVSELRARQTELVNALKAARSEEARLKAALAEAEAVRDGTVHEAAALLDEHAKRRSDAETSVAVVRLAANK
jgi:chromosome segregation ATPase